MTIGFYVAVLKLSNCTCLLRRFAATECNDQKHNGRADYGDVFFFVRASKRYRLSYRIHSDSNTILLYLILV